MLLAHMGTQDALLAAASPRSSKRTSKPAASFITFSEENQ
jgi:hypothetical protein